MTSIDPHIYQAIVVRKALDIYRKTHMMVNRAYTPTNMLRTAGHITKKEFKRGQYAEASAALTEWLENARQNQSTAQ